MSNSFGPSSVASNSHGSHKHETKSGIHGSTKPIVYELVPPKWRPRLHPGSRAIGAPDVYIPRPKEPGPPEDEMSEVNVRNGLNARPAVGNETFSAHDMIYDRLKGKQVVHQLGSLFEEIAQRRNQLAGLRCGPTASQYRQPQRVTLNEVKLAAYVKDLADPSVPISKLARSVPHGYRGERMLDMLWNGGSVSGAMAAMKSQPSIGSSSSNSLNSNTPGGERNGLPNSVEISRAVWFIRVVGASEISSSRLRQGNSATYTSEWTATMMGWLRRQIVELIITHHHSNVSDSPAAPPSPMPSRNRSSLSTPQHNEELYALILEDDFRDRWMAKWNYSVTLLRALANEGLIDCQVAARFSIDMFRTANVAQIFITLALFQEFLDVIANSITLSHLALNVLTSKLKDMEEQMTSSSNFIQKEINAILLYLFDTRPDSFVSPSCWQDLSRIIKDARKSIASDCQLKVIAERNNKLLNSFTNFTSTNDEQSSDLARLQDLQILDRILAHEDLQSTFEAYFGRYCTSISDRIRTLLIWATSEWRVGIHRPFAVATMLSMYVRYQPSRSQKRGTHKSKEGKRMVLDRIDLDAIVMSWITDVDLAKKQNVEGEKGEGKQTSLRWQNVLFSTSLHEMIVLIGELCRLGCFSFQRYLQRLTARGLTAMGGRETRSDGEGVNGKHQELPSTDSLHSKLLRSVPLIACPAPLEHQRRVAIYGNRAKESWEEAMERRALRELSSAFPWLSGSQDVSEAAQIKSESEHFDLQKVLPRFWASSRYIRSRIVQSHLLPSFRDYIYGQEVLQDYQLSQFLTLLIEAQEFTALQEVLEDISQHPQTYSETTIKIANSFARQNRLVLLCMGSIFRSDNERSTNVEEASMKEGEGDPASKEARESGEDASLSNSSSSLKAFRAGHQSESIAMMKNRYTSPRSLLSVTNESLSAGQEGIILDWFKAFLLVSKSESQRWAQDLSICLQDSTLSENDIEILVNLTIAQILSFPSSFTDIVKIVCLPTLNPDAKDSFGNSTVSLRAVIKILCGVFIPSNGSKRSWVVLENGYESSDSNFNLSASIVRIICALKKMENPNQHSPSSNEIKILCASICQDENVGCLLQMNLKESIDLIRSSVQVSDFHLLMRDLLPSRWPWTSDDDLITGMSRIFENVDQWRWAQMLCENAFTIDAIRMKTKEGTIISNKLNELARLFSERILSSIDAACFSTSITNLFGSLSSSSSAIFCIGLVDERLRVLNKQLEATFTDEKRLKSELESLLLLWQKMTPMTISASALSAQTFRFVTDWLESNLPASPVQEIISNQTPNSEPIPSEAELPNGEMAVRLGILCFLMKLDNILVLPITKAFAPRSFCAIIQLALAVSRQPEMSERKIESLLDVARYLLQQAPLELQQAMRQRASEQIESGLGMYPSLFESATETIVRLINNDSDPLGSSLTSNIGGQKISLIEAQSVSSAVLDGQFAAVQIKPWDLHPNVEATVQGKTVTEAGQGSFAQSIASFTEMNNLSNNGPISLQHFRAYRTLDRLPERSSLPLKNLTISSSASKVPFILPSEQNYGMNLAGQPVYARDARRGLLATSNSTAKMGLSAHDLQQLVPALCPPPKHDHENAARDHTDKNAKKDASNGAKKRNAVNEKSSVKTTATKGKAEKKEIANGKATEIKVATGNANPTARKRKTSNASVQDQKATKAATTAASRKRAKK